MPKNEILSLVFNWRDDFWSSISEKRREESLSDGSGTPAVAQRLRGSALHFHESQEPTDT